LCRADADHAEATKEKSPNNSPTKTKKGNVASEGAALLTPTPIHIDLFMRELEVWLVRKGCLPSHGGNKGNPTIRCDQGLESVVYKEGDEGAFPHIIKIPKSLILNFVGRVTQVPCHEAIPICEAWNIQFYVVPKNLKEVESQMFITAWTVPQVPPAPIVQATPKGPTGDKKLSGKGISKGGSTTKSNIVLQVKEHCESFDYKYQHGAKKSEIKVLIMSCYQCFITLFFNQTLRSCLLQYRRQVVNL
jgi:hypothetical protein